MNLTLSFLSGIIAAFTPCVIILMPILLYRFFHEEDKKQWSNFGQFLIGFLLSYIIFGYLLSAVFTSVFQNGFKIGLGLIFITLAILSLKNKLNPLNVPMIKDPFILGTIFSIIISFNPCTLPYLSIIITISNKILLLTNLTFFALGLITPAILFAIFGKKILNISKKTGKTFHSINKIMNYILILSGIYLIYTASSIKIYDIYVISIFLALTFALIIRASFIINKKKDFLKIENIILLVSLFLIIIISITHCQYELESHNILNKAFGITQEQQIQVSTCTTDIQTCSVCKKCIYTFSIASILGLIAILISTKAHKIKTKKQ